ncbi:phosphatidylserine decarboxylase domain-containing protein [Rhizoctonia solani AG-1 IA]|uniref:Phosphatidylserine decarboxylase domain-containing protein n=1 Tax=Thanatephorus cucumeris (strain AG1-IA) TaxID=983506 RepID=L8X1N6_THACA|nr:phosphatidylserine decarboxylase domain-containing protein [Rhizoctonia solani AG-1 IA]
MQGALIRSQPWLTIAAARAIITIQAPGPIGLVCFIAVGMVEVSTCDIRVKPGDSVSPGTELGMFHFGGSSHAVIFGPHVKLAYRNEVKPEVHQRVNKILQPNVSYREAALKETKPKKVTKSGATSKAKSKSTPKALPGKKKRKAKRDQTKTDKESKEHKSVLNFANLPIELFLEVSEQQHINCTRRGLLPFDQISKQLDPLDLFHLSRANKLLGRIFMNRGAAKL